MTFSLNDKKPDFMSYDYMSCCILDGKQTMTPLLHLSFATISGISFLAKGINI